MKAIILAAGIGKRLGNLNGEKPKCLIKIGDQRLLEIQLDTLYDAGIDEFIVVKGYKGDQIDIPGIKYIENPDFEMTNVLHSLFCARSEIEGELAILYSDILYYKETVSKVIESKQDIALGTLITWPEILERRSRDSIEDIEMINFDADNKIVKIGKGFSDSEVSQGIFTGIMKLSSDGSELLKRHYELQKRLYGENIYRRRAKFEQAFLSDLLDDMARLGVPLHAVVIKRGWLEINTPEDYQMACQDVGFLSHVVKMPTNWAVRSENYDKLDWVNRDVLLDAIVELASNLGSSKVLDLGIGTGKVLIALKEQNMDIQGYGVDTSQEMLAKIPSHLDFKLYNNPAEDLSIFGNETFDLVTARMVFHHLSNPLKTIKEVGRVMKKSGRIIICEGNPPSKEAADFYVSMFRFKETRLTFLESDLINLVLEGGFDRVKTATLILRQMSLNNWLQNSGLPRRNIEIITQLHHESPEIVKKAYNMKFIKEDVLMDWKFSIVTGIKA
ncbi:MAG: methyltransferase domain-containing protein [Candidatus Hodarchaeales archaeon]